MYISMKFSGPWLTFTNSKYLQKQKICTVFLLKDSHSRSSINIWRNLKFGNILCKNRILAILDWIKMINRNTQRYFDVVFSLLFSYHPSMSGPKFLPYLYVKIIISSLNIRYYVLYCKCRSTNWLTQAYLQQPIFSTFFLYETRLKLICKIREYTVLEGDLTRWSYSKIRSWGWLLNHHGTSAMSNCGICVSQQ